MLWNALWFKRNEPSKTHRFFSQARERVAAYLQIATVEEARYSISAGCSHLARGLSGPAPACMRECAHLRKAEHPRNLGYMQLAVVEVTNRQIASQLLKYFSEVQALVRKPSCKRPLTHSKLTSNVFYAHSSMRKQRRDRILNPCAQRAPIAASFG